MENEKQKSQLPDFSLQMTNTPTPSPLHSPAYLFDSDKTFDSSFEVKIDKIKTTIQLLVLRPFDGANRVKNRRRLSNSRIDKQRRPRPFFCFSGFFNFRLFVMYKRAW